ncbi:MAG: hypothetical protein ACP5NC_07070 [Nitrososphaeria archaeon]
MLYRLFQRIAPGSVEGIDNDKERKYERVKGEQIYALLDWNKRELDRNQYRHSY